MDVQPLRRTVTFVRHLKQTHHATDPPLKSVKEALPRYRFQRILCSPYLRCRQTAQRFIEFSDAFVPMKVEPCLSEYQGGKSARRLFRLDGTTSLHEPIPGPLEHWVQFERRMETLLGIIRSHEGDLLIVTHGVVVRYMQQRLCGKSPYTRGRHVPFGRGFSVELE